jgi:hypothetical protein
MALSMWHNKIKMDEKNQNMSLWFNIMVLAQHFFHERLNFIVKHNEYDLTNMMNVINKI